MQINTYRISPEYISYRDISPVHKVAERILDLEMEGCKWDCDHSYDAMIKRIVEGSKALNSNIERIQMVFYIVPCMLSSEINEHCTGFAFRYDKVYYSVITQHTDIEHVIGHELCHIIIDVVFPESKKLPVSKLEEFVDEYHRCIVDGVCSEDIFNTSYFRTKYLGVKNG